jgi:hypothetical protein
MKVNVHSCSYKAHTFEPNYQPNGLQVRIEEIDTETNALFAGCKSLQSIADKYESFWNELNRAPTEIVRVVGIEIVRTNHAIKDWGKPKKKKATPPAE